MGGGGIGLAVRPVFCCCAPRCAVPGGASVYEGGRPAGTEGLGWFMVGREVDEELPGLDGDNELALPGGGVVLVVPWAARF